MSGPQDELESLRRAFAARAQSPAALSECPDAGLLYDAAAGTLDRDRRLEVVEHVARCAECTLAWRLAAELDARPSRGAFTPNRRWMPGLAVAATLIVGMGLTFLFVETGAERPQYRQASDPLAATSTTTNHLPRERFLLRWSPGPPGSSYTLRVSTGELSPLLSKHELATAEFLVPAETLAKVASSQQVLWQVETRLPDGRRVASETFVVTLD